MINAANRGDFLRRSFVLQQNVSAGLVRFLDGPEREDGFRKNFVEHLGQPGVHGGEAADDSFVAGKLLEAGVFGVVPDRQQEKEDGEARRR